MDRHAALTELAQALMAGGKGLLALDESTGTCDKRFASVGIAQTAQARRASSIEQVAAATVQCLRRTVPAAVAGIAFLSGGQSGDLASARLNAMNARGGPAAAAMPWPLTFSFGRALQEPALAVWAGLAENRTAAQQALLRRARENAAARRGDYCVGIQSA